MVELKDLFVRYEKPAEEVFGPEVGGSVSTTRPATVADLLAVVRRGVESGTIKGSVVDHEYGKLIVIPVSDGGSET